MATPLLFPYTLRPSRLISETDKDSLYHNKYARWAYAANTSSLQAQDHWNRITLNRLFYKNKQWENQEDITNFLMDVSGFDKERIKVTYNMIKNIVDSYVGNANQISFRRKVQSISPFSKTRKENELAKLLYFNDIMANSSDAGFNNFMKSKLPIGETAEETESIFENTYVDKYVKGMNQLINYCWELNKLDSYKKHLAESLSMDGISAMKPFLHNGHWLVRKVDSKRFLFDRSCLNYDTSDGDYWGEWFRQLPTDIFEQNESMNDAQRKCIEDYVRYGMVKSNVNYVYGGSDLMQRDGRVPVIEMYWRDCFAVKYGYVKDDYEQVFLAKIDYTEENETKPKYTEKDLIPVGELSEYQKKIIKKDKKNKKDYVTLYNDILRFCKFIPAEVIGNPVTKNDLTQYDVVLDYGIAPYQEKDLLLNDNILPPYKVDQFIYLDGETLSPVDFAIDPQRMMNRLLSVIEHNINNSKPESDAIDKTALADEDLDEKEILRRRWKGDPIFLNAKGIGINNVIGKANATIGQSTSFMVELVDFYKRSIDDTTGVNEAIKGQSGNPRQLVGLTELMIQRGSLIQERFYESLQNIYTGLAQSICSVGKLNYLDEKTKLINILGDEEYSVLELSEGLRNEEFKVFITRTMDKIKEREFVDAKILQYFQLGLLDDTKTANLLHRASEDELAEALRQFGKEKIILRKKTNEMQQQMSMAQQQQEMQYRQNVNALQDKMHTEKIMTQKEEGAADREHDIDMLVLQNQLNKGQNFKMTQ
ncbi:MAG: hypothetical protein PHH82_04940 [Candidatus ainarchaeum sp.]|nr:hypothetical protein [Candidatus ainarchaeum sp.]